ncbi:MAG: CHAT domain-containing protein [Phycisphaerae bacterium]|nr:CHAT domain-containing protein [Saprospiraceae bacterium]
MKKNLILGLLLCLAPVFAGAQVVDTTAVLRELDSLIQVSRTLTGQRDFDKALQVNAAAEKLALEKLGRESAGYGSCCFNRGRVNHFKDDYAEAEKWYLESKAIREKALGKEHLDYEASLNNLALLYDGMGNFEAAEPLYFESKAIVEKALGKDHPDYASSLNNLGGLYYYMGNYEKAEPLYLESKAIREKVLGKEHPDYAGSLNNLAVLYHDMGNYEKSESLQLETKSIYEKELGKEHPYFAMSLNNLANLYDDMGNYEKAELFYLESKAIREKILGKEHPDYATSMDNLGGVYYDLGNYEKAEPLQLEAKAIREKTLGKEHPDYAASLNNLAVLYESQNKFSASESVLAEKSVLEQARLSKSVSFLSERELANYTATFQEAGDNLGAYILVRRVGTGGSQIGTLPALAFDHTLFHKGFLLTTAVRLNALPIASPESKEVNLRLKGYRRRLAAEYAKPITDRKGVAELEEKAAAAEKELTRSVAGYTEAIRQVNWQEVRAGLKKDETAIEFVHFRVNFPKNTDSTMYAALVLRPSDIQPQFVSLFEEKELTPLLRGAAGGSNFLKINALYTSKTADSQRKSLYELIWKPLEGMLKDSKAVYCAPSGLLHRINLAAVATADGQVCGERRQLVVLGSTRQLVIPHNSNQTSINDAYLAGGIRYDSDSTATAFANRGASSRSIEPSALAFQPDSLSITRGGVLDYLPATAAEVREIGQTLQSADFHIKVDTGFYATEESFRQLGVGSPSPRIIHLATHGYFFPDPVASGSRQPALGSEPVFKMSEHPMIRSGLIMAGAKQAWLTGNHPEGHEDGILTAYEISQMNLSGTELVVLSACETGLGDIVGNEGVYGLQRAFKIAGVKYLIMSLWKVDDRSTRAFMTAFYRHWLTEKQSVPQAFRSTQREMRKAYPGAYDWAGFVLIE